MESSEISGFGALGRRRTQFGFGVGTEAFIRGSRNGIGPTEWGETCLSVSEAGASEP